MTFSVTIAWPLGALGRSGSIRCTTTFFGRTARPRRLQYRGRNFYGEEADCGKLNLNDHVDNMSTQKSVHYGNIDTDMQGVKD